MLLEQQMLQHVASWLDNNPDESFVALLCTGVIYYIQVLLTCNII